MPGCSVRRGGSSSQCLDVTCKIRKQCSPDGLFLSLNPLTFSALGRQPFTQQVPALTNHFVTATHAAPLGEGDISVGSPQPDPGGNPEACGVGSGSAVALLPPQGV